MENTSINYNEKIVKDAEETNINTSVPISVGKIEKKENERLVNNDSYYDVSTKNQKDASNQSLKRSQKCIDDEITFKEKKKIKEDLENLKTSKEEFPKNCDIENNNSNKIHKDALYKTGETIDSTHQLTCAIYVRDFTRPLQISHLKSYLLDMVKDINDSNDDILKKVWMDKCRTHAFIVFSTIKYAKKIREGLHNSIWPSEKGRKPLWADYIPENKVDEWIYIEEQNPRDTKWEVVYDAQGTPNLLKIEKKTSHKDVIVLNKETEKRFQDGFNYEYEKKQDIGKYNLNKLFLKTQTIPSLYYKTTSHDIAVDKFGI
ncbi:hypothetical protein PMAC_001465 [Pneumocystis sp. 'macacae']|nr:hypothetical protein PMAC_001465 [Pneumocystis sp. 'macacae']